MRKRINSLWMVIFACFISYGSIAQINVVAEQKSVIITDHFQLIYEVDNSNQTVESIQWNADLFEDAVDIILIESSVSEENDKFLKTITLAVFDTGAFVLPVIVAETILDDGQIEVHLSPEVTVIVFLPEDLQGELRPIKGIIEDPPPSFLWLYFAIALLVLLLILLLWLIVSKRKKIRLSQEPKADFSAIDPEEWAIRQIREIKKSTVDGPEAEEAYFTRLSYIFRNWMKNRFGFKAIEMTGNELMEELENREIYSSNILLELKKMIGKIDQIKYAKGRSNEGFRELATNYIESLIKNHKQELENQKEGDNV